MDSPVIRFKQPVVKSRISGVDHGTGTAGTVGTVLACIVGIGMATLPAVFARAGWLGGSLIMALLPVFLRQMAVKFFRVIEKIPDPNTRPLSSFPEISYAVFGAHGRLITALTLYGEYTLFLSLLMLTMRGELAKYAGSLSESTALVTVATVLFPFAFVRSSKIATKLSIVGMVGIVMLLALLVVAAIARTAASDAEAARRKHELIRFDAFQLGVSVANVMLVFAASGIIPTVVHEMKEPGNFPRVATCVFSIGTAIYTVVGVLAYAAWGDVFIDGSVSVLDKISEMGEAYKICQTVSLVLVCVPQFAITAMVVNQGVDLVVGPGRPFKQLVGRVVLHALQAAIVLGFDKITDLLSVISAFTNVILVVLLPASLSWKLRGTRWFSLVSILFGLVVMTFGSTSAIDSYIAHLRAE